VPFYFPGKSVAPQGTHSKCRNKTHIGISHTYVNRIFFAKCDLKRIFKNHQIGEQMMPLAGSVATKKLHFRDRIGSIVCHLPSRGFMAAS
jgi:hypothetical protein